METKRLILRRWNESDAEDVDVPLMHEKRTGHVSLMTKEDWLD